MQEVDFTQHELAIVLYFLYLPHICAVVLETGPLPPQDHKSGTVCRPISDYVGCHTASSGGYWRRFYSDSEATAKCELFLTAPNRNILTYLLNLYKHEQEYTEELVDPRGWEDARPWPLTSLPSTQGVERCTTLTFDLLTPKVYNFTHLPHRPLVPDWNGFIRFQKYPVNKFGNRSTNRWTD